MDQLKKIAFLIVLVAFSSCKREFEPVSDDFQHKLVVIAELEADVEPEFVISTTYDLDSEPVYLSLQNTMVNVYDAGNPGEPNAFRPKEFGEISWTPPGQFVPRMGKEYQIIVEVDDPDMDMEMIVANAVVPEPGDIELMTPVTYEQDGEFAYFNIELKLQTPPDASNYYHLIPNIKVSGLDVNLDITDIQEGVNGAIELSHRDGMLIDISKLNEDKTLTFEARTLQPVNVSQMVNPRMFYTLKTVKGEYFQYHQNISRSNFTNLGPFTIPVITYSQFIEEGDEEPYGYGVFTALSSVQRSVEITQ